MKISVVTAVKDGRETLPAMLQSLTAQTYDNVEHVVQDGGSTDGTLAYLSGQGHPHMALQSS
ncbi:MAG: glycosyltransferase, partial [Pseudomonadota bacterium]